MSGRGNKKLKILEADEEGKALRCEACGKLGLPETFTKSQRFCSRSCALRFHRCCFKHVGLSHKEYLKRLANGTNSELKKLNSKQRSENKDTKRAERVSSRSTLDRIYSKRSSNIVASSKSKVDLSFEHAMSDDEDIEIVDVINKKETILIPNIPLFENDPSQWSVHEVSEFLGRAGCSDYIEKFQFNEIDGEAFLMLELHHLMDMMGMKLGSAVKLLSSIKTLKKNLEDNKDNKSEQESV